MGALRSHRNRYGHSRLHNLQLDRPLLLICYTEVFEQFIYKR